MSQNRPVRAPQHGAVLLGLSGGLLVVAAGLAGGYYLLGSRGEARAATVKSEPGKPEQTSRAVSGEAMGKLLARTVAVKTASGDVELTWGELGVEVDPDEAKINPISSDADVTALAAKGSLPIRLDRDRAIAALLQLKARHDAAPRNAYLDLEGRKIHEDRAGQGIDVWGSLPRLIAAARQAAPSVELVTVAVPAAVTKTSLGIDDISHVLGHYETKFSVSDKDRNFNLKLAASKVNGYVMKPGEEWSFNDTVGERSQKMGYKVAHVITAGEMVDGLAGGTCQISTTLFGAAFFAGLDIVRTTNHSRPSTYTPLGFDATVVWPNTDLKLKNPYEFPVALRYVVANGEAKVEVLGKARPWDKVVFEREVLETTPFSTEERLDEEMPLDQTVYDQEGFDGYKLERFRRFYKDGKLVKSNKWVVNYKPVTEYIRRGTNPDPNAKMPEVKASHGPKAPKDEKFKMAQ
ncbi:MAG TPA: VanW family protein [Kofleriaceae bacterium]|nr:VanW family protein [Kofleriaceae bacterium]